MCRPVGLLSIQLRCYGMLWFDVPTALLRVQRPCSVPGEVVFCSFRREPQPLLWFVSWEFDCTPVPLRFSKSEIQNPN